MGLSPSRPQKKGNRLIWREISCEFVFQCVVSFSQQQVNYRLLHLIVNLVRQAVFGDLGIEQTATKLSFFCFPWVYVIQCFNASITWVVLVSKKSKPTGSHPRSSHAAPAFCHVPVVSLWHPRPTRYTFPLAFLGDMQMLMPTNVAPSPCHFKFKHNNHVCSLTCLVFCLSLGTQTCSVKPLSVSGTSCCDNTLLNQTTWTKIAACSRSTEEVIFLSWRQNKYRFFFFFAESQVFELLAYLCGLFLAALVSANRWPLRSLVKFD